MDVHRCRFVPYPPSGINAIAVSHPHARSKRHALVARVAIGRANGDVEIWNPLNGTWLQESVLRGGKDRSIDGLVWVTDADKDLGNDSHVLGRMRLFSIGYTSAITEWDLEKGVPRTHASGQHGDIWCLAGQPPMREGDGPGHKLVAGTIDGELAIYTLEDGELRLQRVAVKSPAAASKKPHMVSIAFQSFNVVVVGCTDSSVLVYDIRKGALLRRMTLGQDLAGGGARSRDIIVWSVKCLPNKNIVSADSTGHVSIWDGKTYTQMQKIQAHSQDALSLAVSADGTSIISGGMDRQTVLIRKHSGPANHRWGRAWGRKYHDHDVKAMASFESPHTSVIISGGPDASPVLVPLKNMGKENHRTLSNLPQRPPVMSAPRARFLVTWWNREIRVWLLKDSARTLLGSKEPATSIDQNRKLLKTIVIKGEPNISSATIDNDGTLLVVATTSDIKAFHLEHYRPAQPSDLLVSQVRVPPEIARQGATNIQLSPSGDALCIVRNHSRILTCRVHMPGTGAPEFSGTQRLTRLARKIPKHIRLGGLGGYDRTVHQLAFSPDGNMLAVADLAGYVDTWVVADGTIGHAQNGGSTEEDDGAEKMDVSESESSDGDSEYGSDNAATATGRRWVRNPSARLLPKLPATPVVLSFSPEVPLHPAQKSAAAAAQNTDGIDAARKTEDVDDDYTLLAVTASWHVSVFHPLRGALTPWSRRNPRARLPSLMTDIKDVAKGVSWHGSRAWLYGPTFLCMLDFDRDMPGAAATEDEDDTAGYWTKKRKRGTDTGAGSSMNIGNLVPKRVRKLASGGVGKEWEDVRTDVDEEDPDRASEPERDDGTDGDGDDADRIEDGQEGGEFARKWKRRDGGGGKRDRPPFWLTFKYRPILGMVPMGGRRKRLMESAIVERPRWDVEMPERLLGPDEWERPAQQ